MSASDGFTPPAPANADVKKWTNKAQPLAEEKANRCNDPYTEFDAKIFIKETGELDERCQYFVKVHVGGVSYVHINMYVGLNPDALHVYVAGIKENMAEDATIEPFDSN